MISLRRMIIARGMVRSALLNTPACVQPRLTTSSIVLTSTRSFFIGGPRDMADRRVVNYDDVMKGIEHPNKVIIDVREPDEVSSTGKIPSSINIPLGHVENVLTSMSETDFRRYYQRNKPQPTTELIFYCRSGRRASEAVDKALRLGFTNSKTYIGSWEDWSNKTPRK